MITNKDVRIENGNLVLNGDKYPLDGQSPEAIMQIVKDNSDTTPTDASTNPVTSGGTFTALTGKAEKNPTALSDYTTTGVEAASSTVTVTSISGGYKVKDGMCYVALQVSFSSNFGTPGAWGLLKGFPASAVNGVPLIATPTNNDSNSIALIGGRMNNEGVLFIINSDTITGSNSTAFTFVGSYPIATT